MSVSLSWVTGTKLTNTYIDPHIGRVLVYDCDRRITLAVGVHVHVCVVIVGNRHETFHRD